MPIRGGDLWEGPRLDQYDGDSKLWIVRFTGEAFDTFRDYSRHLDWLRQREWQCRLSGRAGLSFEEAQMSESVCRQVLNERFPPELIPRLCAHIHQSTKPLKVLVPELYAQFMTMKIGEDQQPVNMKAITKSMIKWKIRDCAWKVPLVGGPWMVSDKLAEENNLPVELPKSLRKIVRSYTRSIARQGSKAFLRTPSEKVEWEKQKALMPETDTEEESDEEEIVQEQKSKKQKTNADHYPIEDSKLLPKRDENDVVIDYPTLDSVKIASDEVAEVDKILMILDFFHTFESSLLVTPFDLSDFLEALTDPESSVLMTEMLLGLLEMIRRDCKSGIVLGDSRVEELHVADILSLLEVIEDNLNDYDIKLSWLSNLTSALENVRSVPKLHFSDKLQLLSALVDEALTSPSIHDLLDENLTKRQDLRQQFRIDVANDRKDLQECRKEVTELKKQRTELKQKVDEATKAAKELVVDLDGEENRGHGNVRTSRTQRMAQQKEQDAAEKEQRRLERVYDDVCGRIESLEQKCRTGLGKKEEKRERSLAQALLDHPLRVNFLGTDRLHRHYYASLACGGRIFVHTPKDNCWRLVQQPDQLDRLVQYLNPLGIRERALSNRLHQILPLLESTMAKRVASETARAFGTEITKRVTRRASHSNVPEGYFNAYRSQD